MREENVKKAHTKHVFSNPNKQWAITIIIFIVLYTFFMWYHAVRGKPYSIFTTEKCIAIAVVFCIGFALALGPLSRFSKSFQKALPYRRSLGLTAAFMSVLHVLLVIFYLPYKFPDKYSKSFLLSWFFSNWLTTLMGILILVLLLIIAFHSFPGGVKKLGRRKWMILQKLSYLVMLFLVIHLLSLGKVPGWIEWWRTFNQPFPPGAFTTTTFCVLVLLLKVVDLIVHGDSLAGEAQEKDITADEA